MRKLKFPPQAGITLVEVLMGTLVMAIFIMGLTSLLTFTADQNKKIITKVDQELDSIIGERFLFADLRNATPSLNNITTRDDANLEFFDYIPDVAANAILTSTTRTLTLSADRPRSLVVISMDLTVAPPMIYDPTAAYRFSPAPANFDTAGAFQFVSVNQNNYVNNAQRTLVKTGQTDFWSDGRVMMMDTPARIRPVLANGFINMNTPPRSSIFLGRVSGAALLPIRVPEIKRRHPRYPTVTEVATADYFLRTIPPVSGAAPVVRMTNVKIIRYSVSPSVGKPGRVDIFREIHNGTAFAGRQSFATGLLKVMFMRESIFHPLISFKLVYNSPRNP